MRIQTVRPKIRAILTSASMKCGTATFLIGLAACGRADTSPAAASAETSERAATQVTFTASQVQHGSVRWTVVDSMSAVSTIQVAGRLTANEDRTVRLSAPAQGRLVAAHVRIGDIVSSGQALVTLQSAEAAASRADYSKAIAELNSRRAAAVYARTAAERAERLLAVKAIAKQDVERARADDQLARSELAQAEAEVGRARATLSQLGVNSATGAMVLRSPLSGVVVSREAVPGSVVSAGTPLVTVTDASTLWLDVSVPDRIASSFRPGANVRFSVPAYTGEFFEARVQNVGGALDPSTRALVVRAVVQNPGRRLRPEMFATVWIESGALRTGVSVPDDAVQLLEQKPVVFIARPDGKGGARFERRDVQTGATVSGRTQVLKGIATGEMVVVSGAFAVKAEFARSKMAPG